MWKWPLAWVPLVLVAIANATLRENVFAARRNELQAHQVSSAAAMLLSGIYICVIIRIWRPEPDGQAVTIGLV